MKRFFTTILAILALSCTLFAQQTPKEFSYQAVVRNNAGQLMSNRNVSVRLSILKGSESGMAVYVMNKTVTTNANGLFTLNVGEGSTEYANINWANGPYYLLSEIDPENGSNYTLSTVQKILSVPYAQHAAVADRLADGTTGGGGISSESDPVFRSWAYEYDSLRNRPTRLSDFTNDMGFLTTEGQTLSMNGDTIFLTNGGYVVLSGIAGNQVLSIGHDTIYLTNGGYIVLPAVDYNDLLNKPNLTGNQVLSINGDTLFLTNGGYIILPAVDYNDLLNKPNLTGNQVLSMNGDTLFLTNGGYIVLPFGSIDYNRLLNRPTNLSDFNNDLGYITTEQQVLSINEDTIFLTGGSYVVLPGADWNNITNAPTFSTVAWSGSYNDLTGRPTIPVIPTNVSAFVNDAGYITSANQTFALSDITVNGNSANTQIKNVTNPTDAQDAATKYYVDSVYGALLAQLTSTIESLENRIESLEHPLIEGSLNGIFSVSATNKVTFSRGNLQYMASINTWNFAEHQYDMIGADNSNISSINSSWIDLFGFGTSGWNSGVANYQPWSISTTNSNYIALTAGSDLAGIYANADWGVFNPILNGANQTGMWRTLTHDEWDYILNQRTNAVNLKGIATVNNVTGYILFPDNWTMPEGLSFDPTAILYNTNDYTAAEWATLEAAGAVFLPAAGYRNGTSVNHVGTIGYYWSSSHNDGNSGNTVTIGEGYSGTSSNNYANGCSVRLVREY